MFHKTLDQAEAGDQLGILLRGLKRDDVRRGMALIKPGSIKLFNNFEAKIYMLTKEEGGREKPLTKTYQTQIFSKTWDLAGKMKFPETKEMLMPGEATQVTFILQKKMVCRIYLFEIWFVLIFKLFSLSKKDNVSQYVILRLLLVLELLLVYFQILEKQIWRKFGHKNEDY
jgi:hypothetical protein